MHIWNKTKVSTFCMLGWDLHIYMQEYQFEEQVSLRIFGQRKIVYFFSFFFSYKTSSNVLFLLKPLFFAIAAMNEKDCKKNLKTRWTKVFKCHPRSRWNEPELSLVFWKIKMKMRKQMMIKKWLNYTKTIMITLSGEIIRNSLCQIWLILVGIFIHRLLEVVNIELNVEFNWLWQLFIKTQQYLLSILND